MTTQDYLDMLLGDTEAIAALAAPALDRPVAAYQDWTLARLLQHLGGVQRWVTTIVAGRLQNPPETAMAEDAPPSDTAVNVWLVDGARALVSALEEAGPDTPVWTFGAEHTVGFWMRRMAHEAGLHRWDTEDAVAPGHLIAGDMVVHHDEALRTARLIDAIDEVLTVQLPRWARRHADQLPRLPEAAPRLALRCPKQRDDHGLARWVVTADGPDATVKRGRHPADLTVIGPPRDVWLAAYGRRRLSDGTEVEGDDAALDAWQAWWDVVMQ